MTEKELHDRMEALEKRLGASRRELARLTEQQRMDIGEALAAVSDALEAHEERLEEKR